MPMSRTNHTCAAAEIVAGGTGGTASAYGIGGGSESGVLERLLALLGLVSRTLS